MSECGDSSFVLDEMHGLVEIEAYSLMDQIRMGLCSWER